MSLKRKKKQGKRISKNARGDNSTAIQTNEIKNQNKGDININKAESMNEYIQKQYELYELNRQHYLDSK